jgi:hypothetical protein
MTRAEWIELLIISVASAASWPVGAHFSGATTLWQIALGTSALLLAQSLVRDVTILLRSQLKATRAERKQAQCFCLESTIGATGIVTGSVLAGLANSAQVTISRPEFFLTITGTMLLGFFIKDLVISWKPFGLRREKDHLNLIVRWRVK